VRQRLPLRVRRAEGEVLLWARRPRDEVLPCVARQGEWRGRSMRGPMGGEVVGMVIIVLGLGAGLVVLHVCAAH
jgi:hypothetical protein